MSVMNDYTIEEIVALVRAQEEKEREERELVALVRAQEEKEIEERELVALVRAQEEKEREESDKKENKIERGKEYKLILVLTQTTQSYITSMDALNLHQRAMDEIYPLLKELVRNLKHVTKMYPFMFDGFEKLNAWLVTLENMRASDELTDKTARKLLYEIEKSYASFMQHLSEDHVFLAVGQMVQFYITAMDALRLGQHRVEQIRPLMKEFVISLERVLVIVPTFDGITVMKEWVDKLEEMDVLFNMSNCDSRQLLFELDNSYSSFINHLSDIKKNRNKKIEILSLE